MAIKIIKFDLPINGTKVTTLDELRDNLTDEIVPLARSGQLERWFKSRQLPEQAQAVASAVSQNAANKALFLALCAAGAAYCVLYGAYCISEGKGSSGASAMALGLLAAFSAVLLAIIA